MTATALRVLPSGSGFAVPPLLHRMGQGPDAPILVQGAITGRITQAIFPDRKLVVHELGDASARALIGTLLASAGLAEGFRPLGTRRVALVDMVTNHGHHMLNHLSAVQRLIDRGAESAVDALWTTGRSFFGEVTDLFPAFRGRHRYLPSPAALLEALSEEGTFVLRAGSSFFDAGTRARILHAAGAPRRAPPGDAPLIYVTTRTGGRQCTNLGDCVVAIVTLALSRWPGTQVMIDGWSSWHDPKAGGSLYLNVRHDLSHKAIEAEVAQAQALAARLPGGVVTRLLSGLPMRDSIALCRNVDAYFAHVGTLQHKIGFLSDAVGMAHGPRLQMATPEAGPFLQAGAHAPLMLPTDLVADVEGSGGARGEGFNDYAVTDPDRLAQLFCDHLARHFNRHD